MPLLVFLRGALAVLELASADQVGLELKDLPVSFGLPRAGIEGMHHHCSGHNHYLLNIRIWSATTVSLLFSLSQITIQRFLHVFLSVT